MVPCNMLCLTREASAELVCTYVGASIDWSMLGYGWSKGEVAQWVFSFKKIGAARLYELNSRPAGARPQAKNYGVRYLRYPVVGSALGKKGWNRSRGRSAGRNGIPREFYEVVGGRSSLSEGALVLGVAVGKVKRGS